MSGINMSYLILTLYMRGSLEDLDPFIEILLHPPWRTLNI